jgi:hypothetical protein
MPAMDKLDATRFVNVARDARVFMRFLSPYRVVSPDGGPASNAPLFAVHPRELSDRCKL